MKSKLKFILPVLILLIGAGAYYKMSHKPKPSKLKITGTIYVLPQDFLINLEDGQFAKVAVALVLAPGQSDGATAGSAAEATTASSSGEVIGTLPEEPVIRSIITNELTNDTSTQLLGESSREQIEQQILESIRQQTDVKVKQVLFPDLTVQ
jgi:flagellar basal body-associated protein FliL